MDEASRTGQAPNSPAMSRRRFGACCAGAGASLAIAASPRSAAEEPKPAAPPDSTALVAITLDLEMSRNFPTWETTHWDYEKGNLDADTKRYALEAARRMKRRGGVIHFFAVGRVLEQENVDWLREIVELGHPVGNHTYDHVNVMATRSEDIQFRFQRAPWLIAGRLPAEVIAENVRLTDVALASRVGIKSNGFRTPGGFADGLAGREDIQRMLQSQGFDWVSSKYPAHPNTMHGEPPTDEILEAIVAAQQDAQPFVYPTGLVEVPMSPISDIGAFRNGRWPLESFLEALRRGVGWAIEQRATFDFLGHPSCLLATDPRFRAIELIADLVEQSAGKARLVDLSVIAERARRANKPH